MAARKSAKSTSLLARLAKGPVICAEGYLFEFERRGYLQAGAFVPEIVLEHPDLVEQLHREFVHAGSDVVEAFTYYAHRAKLRLIGREKDLKAMNLTALGLAGKVARETGTLFAGDICNTNVYDPKDSKSEKAVRGMFEEQVGWAADAGVDFVIAETIGYLAEALLALEAIKRVKKTAVVTLAIHRDDITREGLSVVEAMKHLEGAGADVVGLNCIRGPGTMMPLLKKIRRAVKCEIAALPVPYRTSRKQRTFQSLQDADCDCIPGDRPFPTALDPFTCNRYELGEFAKEAYGLGIRYLGVCCGAGPHHIRAVAEALGRHPPASRYSPDMSKHAFLGTHRQVPKSYRAYAKHL